VADVGFVSPAIERLERRADQRDISSSASWLVRGPNNRMVDATTIMEPPISKNTPVTPNEFKKRR